MKLKQYTIFAIGVLVGIMLIISIDNIIDNKIIDQWYDIGYQSGWCDGSHEAISANYGLWECYDNYDDFFAINESRWNVTCYDENRPRYMEIGYNMSVCRSEVMDANRN